MKYNATNEPLKCMMTQSTCYKGTRTMTVLGVLWHSTGANNPWLKRYVQPDDNAPNRQELLNKLGVNTYRNDWNHINYNAGLNCWIGKFNDGTVGTIQTMPWNYRPWGCGSGSKGSCNNGWIQFEICESDLNDATYFNAVYKEACEITAYLCKMYNIDPNGIVMMNGIKVPTILCHKDSANYGLGCDHSDIYHWFSRFGKDMNDVRTDVTELLGGTVVVSTQNTNTRKTLRKGSKGSDVKELQTMLIKLGYSCGSTGADGSFGANTFEAVKKFQADKKLSVDGVVGQKTWASLHSAISTTFQPYTVKVTASSLNIRSGAGTNYSVTGTIKNGDVYTIVDESTGVGANKWGKLKSGMGWISLDYCKKI